MQLIEIIPACVLDTSALWSKGNASCAWKGDYVYFKEKLMSILGFSQKDLKFLLYSG